MMCDIIYDILQSIHNRLGCVGMRFLNCNDCVPPTGHLNLIYFLPQNIFFPFCTPNGTTCLQSQNCKNSNGQVNMVVRGLKELGEVVK